MKYEVTLHGPGGFDTVIVEAEGGDDAAAKAYKPGCFIKGILPAADQGEPVKRGRPPKVEG